MEKRGSVVFATTYSVTSRLIGYGRMSGDAELRGHVPRAVMGL